MFENINSFVRKYEYYIIILYIYYYIIKILKNVSG